MGRPNLVVTGADGFIGSNFCRQVEAAFECKLLSVVRNTSESALNACLRQANFVAHFAGDIRQDASDSDYRKSGSLFTEKVVDRLLARETRIPLLMASSIHAESPRGSRQSYGNDKRRCELLLEKYASRGGRILIYRLPNVFGEGAKPNHNSVLTTWLHNKVHGLPITVYDRKTPITYCHVSDVVIELVEALLNSEREGYLKVPVCYSTSLGEVADYINDIEADVERDGEFYRKLRATYQYYLRQPDNQAV